MSNEASKEKNSILIILYVLACIAFYFIFRYIGENVSAWIMFIIITAAQQVYVLPLFIKNTRTLYGYDTSPVRFIPVINEMQILSPMCAIATCLLTVLFVLGVSCIFIKPEILVNFLPYNMVSAWADRCIWFSIAIGVLLCIIRGAGYLAIVRGIEDKNAEFVGVHIKDKWSFVRLLGYTSLFIPGIRTLGLVLQLPVLNKIVILHSDILEGMLEEEYEEYNRHEGYEEY